VRELGAVRTCTAGDAGYGCDSRSPWFTADYTAPAAGELSHRVIARAATRGFALSPLRTSASQPAQTLYRGTNSRRTLSIGFDQKELVSECGKRMSANRASVIVGLSLEYPSNSTGEAASVEAQPTEEVLVNAIGDYSGVRAFILASGSSGTSAGTGPVFSGPSILVLHADGAWTIR